MQQPVGEDVAPLPVGAELDLVDRQERHRPVERHRLDGADEIPRALGDDLLFAGDEGDGVPALHPNHAFVVLARQQAERKADHAAHMTRHPLDREMGLARVGGPEDGGDTPAKACRSAHTQEDRTSDLSLQDGASEPLRDEGSFPYVAAIEPT